MGIAFVVPLSEVSEGSIIIILGVRITLGVLLSRGSIVSLVFYCLMAVVILDKILTI